MTAWCYSLMYRSARAQHQQRLWTAHPQTPFTLPVWQPALQMRIAADQYATAPIALRRGRFYPSPLLRRKPRPALMFRVVDIDAEGMLADFNHALGAVASPDVCTEDDSLIACDLKAEVLLHWAGIETSLDQDTDFNDPNAIVRDDRQWTPIFTCNRASAACG